jgi:hypothetical protein
MFDRMVRREKSPLAPPGPRPKAEALHRCAAESCSPGAWGNQRRQSEISRSVAMGTGPPGPLGAVSDALRSPGTPLDAPTLFRMGLGFGHDFSKVRVHADRKAAETARALHAQAYTAGTDIVFAPGRYSPETAEGRRLLAHELTHVVQQAGRASIPGSFDSLSVSSPGDTQEREADAVSDQFPHFTSTPLLGSVRDGSVVFMKPDVGFTVRSLKPRTGQLGDPSDDGTGTVSWPLDFSVDSPMRAEADVEVTGGTGDPCSNHTVGWLQTVHMHWLRAHYQGWQTGHGRTVSSWLVPLPIRDGESGTAWYSGTAQQSPTACGTHVHPVLDDYPTLFTFPKVHANSLTGQPNYLTGVTRGIHFVSTLAAQNPSGFEPLRFFYWNFQMSIDLRPDTAHPQHPWPFTWRTNRANVGAVQAGSDPTVPLFTTPTKPYNDSLTMQTQESS